MNEEQFIEYIHEYNQRILRIAHDNGFKFMQASVLMTDNTIYTDGGFSELSDDDQNGSILAINNYFLSQRKNDNPKSF